MANVTASTNLRLSSSQTPVNLPGTVSPLTLSESILTSYGNGTGSDQVDTRYAATLSLSASVPIALDLTNLTDTSGNPISFARVRRLLFLPVATGDGETITLGYASTVAGAWTSLISNPGRLTLQASSAANAAALLIMAPNATGWVVNSGSKLLQIDPGSHAQTLGIEILGCSV